MVEKVAAYMEQHHMVKKGDHISAGISGGADSVCLFLVLERLRRRMGFSVSVIHIEHGIRGDESLEDMLFVKRLADQYGIPFTCRAYPVEDIAARRKISVEEAGREARYEAFQKEEDRFRETAEKQGGSVKTAVAHHGNDNAETMLFHLCRGSGIEGLSGIRPVRGSIIRPLLCVTRNEIEEFLKAEGQEYRMDATNSDVRYTRNRIRNRIMPELTAVNEQAVLHMNQIAEDMDELAGYIRVQAEQILKDAMEQKEGVFILRTDVLESCPQVIKSRIILEFIAAAAGSRKDIGREHVRSLLQIAEGQTGRRLSLPYGLTAEKTYGKVRIFSGLSENKQIKVPVNVTEAEAFCEITVGTEQFRCRVFFMDKKDVKIPKKKYTKWFDYDKIENGLYFRTREPGDYLELDHMGRRQKLKNYWINEKVPKAVRETSILLADGSHVLWVVGYRISAYYKITENTRRVLEVQYMEENYE